MQLSGVRLSVCLSHPAAARRCGGFAAVDIERLLHDRRASGQQQRRANAGSATLSAYLGS